MRKTLYLLLVSVCALVVSTAPMTAASHSPETAKVYLEPSVITATAVNEAFTVEVRVEGITDLAGWEIGLEWNSSVLECTGLREGPFLKTGGATIGGLGIINNTAGRIEPPYSYTLTYPATVGVNGNGTLAYVDFRVKDYWETWMNLTDDTQMSDSHKPWPNAIPVGLQAAWFRLTLPPHEPKASFTHSSLVVGQAVTFDASASEPGFNGTHPVPIANYTWDFGDGTNGTGMIAAHTYATVGTYTVGLTVTCADDSVLLAKGLTRASTTANVTICAPPLIYLEPSAITATAVNEAFTVEVRVEGITDLYAWAIGISWDPAVLNCTGLREGPFLKTGGNTVLTPGTIDNTMGNFSAFNLLTNKYEASPYGCTLIVSPPLGVDGNGTLAYVDFRARTTGISNVYPAGVMLRNSRGLPIQTRVADTFTVVLYGEAYHVVVVSNLTGLLGYHDLGNYAFNQSAREISFDIVATGEWAGLTVSCEAAVPRALLGAPPPGTWTVLLDGGPLDYAKVENGNRTSLSFNCSLAIPPGTTRAYRAQVRGTWVLGDPIHQHHIVEWAGKDYDIYVISNSTVSTLALNGSAREVSFNVTGPGGTAGFCNVTIPKSLLRADSPRGWRVLIDGESAAYAAAENATHASIYFTYTPTTHTVQIRGTHMGEVAAGILYLYVTAIIVVVALAVAVALWKKTRPRKR